MTAVTTAGLLAGLFGSAFVPAARAAADDATTVGATCTGSDNTGAFASLAQKCTYTSSVKPVISIPVVYTDAGNDLGIYTVTVTGSTFFASPAVTRVNTGAGTIILNNGVDTFRENVTTAANADGSTYVFTLNTIAAGSSATVKVTDDDSTLITLTVSSIATGVAAVATPYTSVVLDQTTTRSITDDVTANSATGIAGTTSVNNSVDYVSAAFGTDGIFEWDYIVRDAYAVAGMNLTAKQYTAAVSPTTCGTVDIGSSSVNATNSFAATTSAVGADGSANNTTDNLFVGWKHPGADKGCLATITITEAATGTVIDTFKIGALGETASVTLTGPAYVAADLATNEDMESQLVIVAKDSNGITIPGTFANPSFTAKDDDGVALTITPVDDALTADEGGTANDNKFGFLATGLCPADSEGEVRTIYAEGETLVATGKAKSNTISVTCTGKLAYVSAIAFGKTSYYPSESATVTFTMKDSAGRTAGVGSYMVGTGFAMTNSPATGGSATTEPASVIDSLDTNDDGADAAEKGIVVKTGGTYEFSYVMGTAAGVAGFLFDIADNDGATTGSQQGLFTVKTVVTAAFAAVSDATISAGPKKLVATATFGAAAGKKVAFVLENASGVTKTYYRKANASGVAKYTIALRGTWTVYATFGDEITDTVTLRK